MKEKEPMLNYNNDDYWKSAKEAISIAKVLGDKVIVLGTSHGGVLSLSLGTDPKIVAICLFAPNIEVFEVFDQNNKNTLFKNITNYLRFGNLSVIIIRNK